MMRYILYTAVAILFFACNSQSNTEVKTKVAEKPTLDARSVVLANQEDSLNKVLREQPDNMLAFVERAKVNFQQQELEVAIGDATRALELDSTNADARFLLGKFQFTKEDFYNAQLSFERCIEDNPNFVPCLEKMGEIYLLRGNYKEAITYINQALKINELNYYPYYLKGLLYREMGDSAKAASSLQTAVELNPDFYDGYIMIGALYYGANDPLCLEYFSAAKGLQPQSSEAIYFMAMYYQNNGQSEEALAQYNNLRNVNSNDPRGWYNAGFIQLTQTEGYDSAVYYFDQAIAIVPKYPQAYYNKGLAWLELGETAKAKAAFTKAKAIDPNYTLAIQALNELNGE